jgi:hypothetical protein
VRRAQEPSGRGLRFPLGIHPDAWGSQDREIQQWRFHQLARTPMTVELPGQPAMHKEPYLRGQDQRRLLRLRCGAVRCGVDVGAVYSVPVLHRGSPFTWVECHRIDEPGRKTTMQIFCMVIDPVSEALNVDAECARHGLVTRPVRELMDALPQALVDWTAKQKPGKFALHPVSSESD